MKKVLIVDDSETIRQQVGRALEQAGFAVIEAGDGVDGLEKIAEVDNLAMAILDVNMPRMSGLEMLDRLRQNPKTANLPVLMLTTEAQESLIDRARKSGAKGWLIKPVKLEHLVLTVNKLAS